MLRRIPAPGYYWFQALSRNITWTIVQVAKTTKNIYMLGCEEPVQQAYPHLIDDVVEWGPRIEEYTGTPPILGW